MIKRLLATSVIALAALSGCSDEDSSEQETPVAQPTVEQSPTEPAGTDSSLDGANSDGGTMVVEGDVAISSDDRYQLTLAEGWQAYPAPLDGNVNITILPVAAVNSTEFVPNLIGTWGATADGAPTSYEEWEGLAQEAFAGEGVEVEAAEPIDINGTPSEGLQVTRNIDGLAITQLVYPIFTDGGFQEIAFSASPEDFEEYLPVVQDMLSSLESAN